MTTVASRIKNQSLPDGGGCVVWTGYMVDGRHPKMNISGKSASVRKQAWLLAGREIKAGHQIGMRCTTVGCILVSHMCSRTRRDRQVGRKRGIVVSAAISRGKQRASHLNEEAVRLIRLAATGTSAAREYKISITHANIIRRGLAWKTYNSPWAGLLE